MNLETIYIDDYNYSLPDERIAKYPLPQRDASKLLVYKNGAISESVFSKLSAFMPQNALMLYNNTRVIQARLEFFKTTGARIEVFCLEPIAPRDYAMALASSNTCVWKCMVGNLKKWKEGSLTKKLHVGQLCFDLHAELLETDANTHNVRFSWDNADVCFADILENAGELPIPPYLHRQTEESDMVNYQTVYSRIKGSVAAPTAGLHFTDAVFESLKQKNTQFAELTLHVGAGTFQPVKTNDVAEHTMHNELISVSKQTIQQLLDKKGPVVAVGTTTVRTLESLYYIGVKLGQQPTADALKVNQWEAYENLATITTQQALQNIVDYLTVNKQDMIHADTQILIRPGFQFRLVDAMITNFHQPKSTLLLLVSAFVGPDWRKIYDYASNNDFRFLSYGDSSILFRKQ